MATDLTEPRSKMILGMTAASVVVLFVTRSLLTSYFHWIADEEIDHKVASVPFAPLVALHEKEKQALLQGPLPIEQAKQAWIRSERGAEAIRPEKSYDTSPLQGWIQMPHTVPASFEETPPVGTSHDTVR